MKGVTLKKTILEAVEGLEAISVNVVVFVSDQGSNFNSLIKSLGVTVKKPYFVHSNKINAMADAPHVLKSTQNCLAKCDIESSTGTAQWSTIYNFYKLDKRAKV